MKTWEMVKELTENPEKKFYNKNESEAGNVYSDGVAIRWEDTAEPVKLILMDKRDWREVKEPVSFIGAVGGEIMSSDRRQYKIAGTITLMLDVDYFQDELPKSDILQHFIANALSGNEEIKIVNSMTNSIHIKDMTR